MDGKVDGKDSEENSRRGEIEFFLKELEALFEEIPNIINKEKAYIDTTRPQRIVGGNIVDD